MGSSSRFFVEGYLYRLTGIPYQVIDAQGDVIWNIYDNQVLAIFTLLCRSNELNDIATTYFVSESAAVSLSKHARTKGQLELLSFPEVGFSRRDNLAKFVVLEQYHDGSCLVARFCPAYQ